MIFWISFKHNETQISKSFEAASCQALAYARYFRSLSVNKRDDHHKINNPYKFRHNSSSSQNYNVATLR